MIPIIAIVGRPNVGKSTLFNRLVGWRKALVDDMPGVTRDRIYSPIEWNDRQYHLVDTGGFEPVTPDDVLRHMRVQTELAIQEADAIIFLLDGKEGLLPSDKEVIDILRRERTPLILAVNKVDSPKHEERALDFYGLGIEELFLISAEHGVGITDLMDAVQAVLPGQEEEEEPGRYPRISVVGKPNVGKSTLINSLLGKERHLVHNSPGTTRDAIDSQVEIDGKKYTFIDTAGIRRKAKVKVRIEKFSVVQALHSLDRSDVALLVIDATEGVTEEDARIGGLCVDRGRATIILLNKWDLVENREHALKGLIEQVREKLKHLSFAPILSGSAKSGQRLVKLAPLIDGVMEQYTRRVQTSDFNGLIDHAVRKHQPHMVGGKRLKFYYGTQASTRPPSFVLFVNRPGSVHFSYRRYLINMIRQRYGFDGTPIRLFFRAHHD